MTRLLNITKDEDRLHKIKKFNKYFKQTQLSSKSVTYKAKGAPIIKMNTTKHMTKVDQSV